MFSGYIFDVEGTRRQRAVQPAQPAEALDQTGLRVPYATLQLYSGLDSDQTLQIIEPGLGEAQRKQILQRQGKIYEAEYLPRVKAFEGVREVLETLTQRGGKIALATDCKGPELKHFLSL